jgi:hypothetical protein
METLSEEEVEDLLNTFELLEDQDPTDLERPGRNLQ